MEEFSQPATGLLILKRRSSECANRIQLWSWHTALWGRASLEMTPHTVGVTIIQQICDSTGSVIVTQAAIIRNA